jgi:YbbR domain-containing protein
MKSSVWTKLKYFATHNWVQKLVSILMAVGIWYYVNSLELTENTLNLPIAFMNLPPDMVLVNSSDTIAELSVSARKNIIKNNSLLKEINPYVDLTNARIGEYEYKISINITNPDLQFQVNLKKQYVTLKIDRLEIKNLPIKPKIIGQVSEGFVMESIILNTNEAAVHGASEAFKDLQYIETGPIDISGITNSIEKIVKLTLPASITEVKPSEVLVVVQIQEKRLTREEVFPVKLNNLSPGYSTPQPPQVLLILNIPGSLLSGYKEKISISVDCSSVNAPGAYTFPLEIDAPKGVQIVNKIKYLNIPFALSSTN